uniref:Uncharacterized protein n=1 Tax=Setaria viridis TaxID=4556 RepID=A0A4U6SZ07_SETVI|nr:hypothetical protein SEVIR_9G252966v2 [Setaria viridis]
MHGLHTIGYECFVFILRDELVRVKFIHIHYTCKVFGILLRRDIDPCSLDIWLNTPHTRYFFVKKTKEVLVSGHRGVWIRGAKL